MRLLLLVGMMGTLAACGGEGGCGRPRGANVQLGSGEEALAGDADGQGFRAARHRQRARHPRKEESAAQAPAEQAAPDAPVSGLSTKPPAKAGCRVRLMAANITSGRNQAYELPGIHIFQALAPDVVMIQEFNVGEGGRGRHEDFVRGTFGPAFQHYVESGSPIPNGIVSRFPILSAGEWTNTTPGANRDYAWARVDVPGPQNLFVVSVHLRTKGGPRAGEESELVSLMRRALKPDDVAVLGGDFNHDAHQSPTLAGAAEFLSLNGPLPTNLEGRSGTSANLSKVLDHLFVGPALLSKELPITMGGKSYANGLVFTSDMAPPSDIAPVLPRDSFAANMQHMPIVRDFALCEAP